MIDATNNFDKFAKHIFALKWSSKKMNAYVGLSNKLDHLKIKCDENDSTEILQEFHDEVSHTELINTMVNFKNLIKTFILYFGNYLKYFPISMTIRHRWCLS